MNVAPDVGFFTIAASIFFVFNAVGQIPLFAALLSPYPHARQIKITIREMVIALCVLLLFTFFGDDILTVLGISRAIIAVAGGVLLFLISLTMIFPRAEEKPVELKHEPMVIPLAIPVITGPGAITTVMLYSHETANEPLVAAAVVAAWIPSVVILLLGSYIKRILGPRGMIAVERFGGMLVCLIGSQMFTSGIIQLVKEAFPGT